MLKVGNTEKFCFPFSDEEEKKDTNPKNKSKSTPAASSWVHKTLTTNSKHKGDLSNSYDPQHRNPAFAGM